MSDLKKQLGVGAVFSIGAGAMISSGLFVLPAIAYNRAGPAAILSYALAALLVLPSAFSKAELATAMPKAGGTYFYVERSLGPVLGLFSGFANWFSVALKSAFAIVGMAALVQTIFWGSADAVVLKAIAVGCTVIFTILNIVSVKHTGRFQSLLVAVLIIALAAFVAGGAPRLEITRYQQFFASGWREIIATAGLVFISYGGLTKVSSIAEEIKNPRRNIVRGMLLAWLIVSILYVLAVLVAIGVTSAAELGTSLAPLSLAASKIVPGGGHTIMSVAAFAAFVTTAVGGILTASRSPMSMSRDRLLPSAFARVSPRFGTPHISILITSIFIISAILLLDIEVLVKTASTMMIILFILANSAVIIMRESRIQSYRPTFRSPFYPYLQITSIVIYLTLLVDMGVVPLTICGLFVLVSVAWYLLYAKRRVTRNSAVMHIVERITDRKLQSATLESELCDILFDRDEIIEDRFDHLIRNCEIIDLDQAMHHEELFRRVSSCLAARIGEEPGRLQSLFLEREAETGTVIQPGLAIPHVVLEGEHIFDIVPVRAKRGVAFPGAAEAVTAMFVLVGSPDERNFHLRALMAIAQITQGKDFDKRWLAARDKEAIRNLILLASRKRDCPD